MQCITNVNLNRNFCIYSRQVTFTVPLNQKSHRFHRSKCRLIIGQFYFRFSISRLGILIVGNSFDILARYGLSDFNVGSYQRHLWLDKSIQGHYIGQLRLLSMITWLWRRMKTMLLRPEAPSSQRDGIEHGLSARIEVDLSIYHWIWTSRYLVFLGLTDEIIYGTHQKLFFEEFHESILEIQEANFMTISRVLSMSESWGYRWNIPKWRLTDCWT